MIVSSSDWVLLVLLIMFRYNPTVLFPCSAVAAPCEWVPPVGRVVFFFSFFIFLSSNVVVLKEKVRFVSRRVFCQQYTSVLHLGCVPRPVFSLATGTARLLVRRPGLVGGCSFMHQHTYRTQGAGGEDGRHESLGFGIRG